MFFRFTTSLAAVVALLAGSAFANVTNERNYTFGDDSFEDAANAAGGVLGTGSGNIVGGFTLDSGEAGDPSGSFIDIEVFGNPTYVDATSRPGATPGSRGASFDGDGDYLTRNLHLNRPDEFWDNINLAFDGTNGGYPFNYDTLLSHGVQLWAKPNTAGMADGNVQHLVRDTSDGGGFYIGGTGAGTGFWGLDYDDELFPSNVPVDTTGDGWTHLMQVGGYADPTGGKSAAIGVLWVDGIAAAATNDVYDGADGEPLTIGSNLTGDDNFYNGDLDDLRIFLWGDNTGVPNGPGCPACSPSVPIQVGQDYGVLDLNVDNDWIANELAELAVTAGVGSIPDADLDFDGDVDVAGDVPIFVANWLSTQTIGQDNVQVGDWSTRQKGDFNYDGTVDIVDWSILNAASPSAGAAAALAISGANVPEPGTLLLASLAGIALVVIAKRR